MMARLLVVPVTDGLTRPAHRIRSRERAKPIALSPPAAWTRSPPIRRGPPAGRRDEIEIDLGPGPDVPPRGCPHGHHRLAPPVAARRRWHRAAADPGPGTGRGVANGTIPRRVGTGHPAPGAAGCPSHPPATATRRGPARPPASARSPGPGRS